MENKMVKILLEMLEDYMWECEGETLRTVMQCINAIEENEGL